MRWGVDRRCWGGPLEVSTARGSSLDPYGTNGTKEAVWDAVQGAGGAVQICAMLTSSPPWHPHIGPASRAGIPLFPAHLSADPGSGPLLWTHRPLRVTSARQIPPSWLSAVLQLKASQAA